MSRLNFDSNEELYFSWYLEELKGRGFIDEWKRNEESFELTKGLKHEYIKKMKKIDDKKLEQAIFHPSFYTPDFIIYWNKKALGIFVSIPGITKGKISTPFLSDESMVSYVETKADFDRSNMTRLANNNIKFLYDKTGIITDLVKIPGIFKKTFTPDRYLMTDKTFQPRKIKHEVRSLSTFIKSIQ